MLVMTSHRRFVAVDHAARLVQRDIRDVARFVEVEAADAGTTIAAGPLRGYTMLHTEIGVHFFRDGKYLCADPDRDDLMTIRVKPDAWETFALRTLVEARAEIPRLVDAELARFVARVAALVAAGQPVKLYCGAGNAPRPGFLNLDIKEYAPDFAREQPDDYFIFPFADMPWGIPDACVDYIFHEDFLEHLTQLQHVQFLAEALRVMRPGAYHRVNSPNLLWSMRTHSRFQEGMAGVYRGELKWGHVCLPTPGGLQELAELVGYRRVIFTAKDQGLSPYAEPDCRPDYDRDPVQGNVIADLQK